jgi:hypothetical protein
VRAEPRRHRPELALLGPTDHVELGSTLRSAAAFGWERVFVEDTAQVWFGRDRATIAEGRAAARRHRNPLRVIPIQREQRFAFDEVCVVQAKAGVKGRGTAGGTASSHSASAGERTGVPLSRAGLARGPRQLLAIPDESGATCAVDWARFAPAVRFAAVDLPPDTALAASYRYRLIATIALAEAARQIGRRAATVPGRAPRQGPVYDSGLRAHAKLTGELVWADELECY